MCNETRLLVVVVVFSTHHPIIRGASLGAVPSLMFRMSSFNTFPGSSTHAGGKAAHAGGS